MPRTDLKHVTIYTDGACRGNPGPGGYAAILIHNGKRKEVVGGYRCTTNNRMEIMAAIAGLQALRSPCAVTLYTDSAYLAKSMTEGWVQRWQANDWKRNKRERAINIDLWEQLLTLCDTHDVRFAWVKGHADSTENKRCDQLACKVAQSKNLPADPGYENSCE